MSFKAIKSFFSPESKDITKSLKDEERMALFVVLEPQESIEDVSDLHGDFYTEEDVWDACKSFNMHCQKANLMHLIETEDMEFIQSFVTPSEFSLETPEGERVIKKGTWMAWVYFPETEMGDYLWEGVKKGEFNGLSVQCNAKTMKIEE